MSLTIAYLQKKHDKAAHKVEMLSRILAAFSNEPTTTFRTYVRSGKQEVMHNLNKAMEKRELYAAMLKEQK